MSCSGRRARGARGRRRARSRAAVRVRRRAVDPERGGARRVRAGRAPAPPLRSRRGGLDRRAPRLVGRCAALRPPARRPVARRRATRGSDPTPTRAPPTSSAGSTASTIATAARTEGLVALVDDRIVLEERVLFDVNRARVRSRAWPVLRAIAELYRQHPEWIRLRVKGHADVRGARAFNQRLSELGARQVPGASARRFASTRRRGRRSSPTGSAPWSCTEPSRRDDHERPYTGTIAPRATVLSGEARNRTAAATSSTFGQREWSARGMSARLRGVSMIDGATAFT